ncbi:hypothetical protein HK405_013090 [Cladochytrium tenue]|nr:hypothetical protein HK405_013090 [Cladochytrium tenue]
MATDDAEKQLSEVAEQVKADGSEKDSGTAFVVDPQEEARVMRKVDWAVLPVLCGFYYFQALDKGNLSFAKLGGVQTDTGTQGTLFNVAISMFFVGYALVVLPLTLGFLRIKPRYLISFIGTAWGLCSLLMSLANNAAGLSVARFFLGVFEAGILPLSLVITATWYPRKEHAVKTTIWFACSSIGTVTAGLISYGVQTNLSGGFLHPWGYLLFIEGGATIIWGILALFITPDIPEKATFLTDDEKLIVVNRMEADRTQTKVAFSKAQMWEAVTDPATWMFALIYFCWQCVNSAFSLFGPQIIASLGFGNLQAQLYSAPGAAFNFVIQVVMSVTSDKSGDRSLHLVVAALLSVVAYLTVIAYRPATTDSHGQWTLYGVLFFASFNPGSLTIVLGWATSNIVGTTKRIFVSSMLALTGAFSGIAGSYIYEDSDKPRYVVGHSTNMSLMALGLLTVIGLRILLAQRNKKKEAEYGPVKVHLAKSTAEAFEEDHTDRDPDFRYYL